MGNPEANPQLDFGDDETTAQHQTPPAPENRPIIAPVAKPARKIPAGFDPFGRETGKEDKRYN